MERQRTSQRRASGIVGWLRLLRLLRLRSGLGPPWDGPAGALPHPPHCSPRPCSPAPPPSITRGAPRSPRLPASPPAPPVHEPQPAASRAPSVGRSPPCGALLVPVHGFCVAGCRVVDLTFPFWQLWCVLSRPRSREKCRAQKTSSSTELCMECCAVIRRPSQDNLNLCAGIHSLVHSVTTSDLQ